MYSGITSGLFDVIHVNKKPGLMTYTLELNSTLSNDLKIGDSVSIDGVCQTVVRKEDNHITFEVVSETLQRTTLSDLHVGRKVSVENTLRYGDVIGGHEIAGHVIGTAIIIEREEFENNLTLTLQCPKEWLKYIFPKGFSAVDGSSLTVGETNPDAGTFKIHLIPETLRLTNFGNKGIGDKVNIELDFKIQAIVKTVERILNEMLCKQSNYTLR